MSFIVCCYKSERLREDFHNMRYGAVRGLMGSQAVKLEA